MSRCRQLSSSSPCGSSRQKSSARRGVREVLAGVLSASVAMKQLLALRGRPLLPSYLQRVDHQAALHARLQAPAHHPPAELINHNGQKQPAFVDGDIGSCSTPLRIASRNAAGSGAELSNLNYPKTDAVPVGSRTGAVSRRSSLAVSPRFLWECLNSPTVNPSPVPATSHPACRFPALGAPVCFVPRVMGPIVRAWLSPLTIG